MAVVAVEERFQLRTAPYIEAIIAYIKQGLSVSRAIDKAWETHGANLPADVIERLAKLGAGTLVHGDLHGLRSDGDTPGMQAFRITMPANETPSPFTIRLRLETIRYAAADGLERPLITFTRDDYAVVEKKCRSQAAGLVRIADFMAKGVQLLDAHGVTVTSELPTLAQVTLERQWPFAPSFREAVNAQS